jgi:hypothetical protein
MAVIAGGLCVLYLRGCLRAHADDVLRILDEADREGGE